MLVGTVVIGMNPGNEASANTKQVYANVISICRPTRNNLQVVVETNALHYGSGAVQFQFFVWVPSAPGHQEYAIIDWGERHNYGSVFTSSKFSELNPTTSIPIPKSIPIPAGPVKIAWSSYYLTQYVSTGNMLNIAIGCPPTEPSAVSAPAVVSIGKVVTTVLNGVLARLNVTERILSKSLLSITGHGVLKNDLGSTTPVTWWFSRTTVSKPWTGELTVSLPTLGGRGVFAHNIAVFLAKSGQVTGQVSREVTMNGRLQTETANWKIGPISKWYN
jgi:hypothetical protein